MIANTYTTATAPKLFLAAILFCNAFTFYPANLFAQSHCDNSDFINGNFDNWLGSIGFCCPINTGTNVLVQGRHTIMSGTGMDLNTNNAIPVVAPGDLYSARLGNDIAGSEAEKLSFSFNVTTDRELFVYKYAVVLEDPGHGAADQPRFEIRVFDSLNQQIGCGFYNVVASANIAGFTNIHNQFGADIVYKDWSSVGVDLSSYSGQNITIEFATGDCAFGGHYGYAYISAYCSPLSLEAYYCDGFYDATIQAPEGFYAYQWSSGETTSGIHVQNPVNGSSYSCVLTSFTGCTVAISSILTPTKVTADFDAQSRCIDHAGFLDKTIVSNSTVKKWNWNFGDNTFDSVQHPTHTYTTIGVYDVQLLVTTKGGCVDSITKQITVHDYPEIKFTHTLGCVGIPLHFENQSIASTSPNTGLVWNINNVLYTNVSSAIYTHNTTDSFPATLIVTNDAGCTDSITEIIPMLKSPRPAFDFQNNCALSPLQFFDKTVSDFPIIKYVWDLGDGKNSHEQNPIHKYTKPGNYLITLLAENDKHCVGDTSLVIKVLDTLIADFIYSPDKITTLTANVSFINYSLKNLTFYHWDFGDGYTSDYFNEMHRYAEAGLYPVQLWVTNNDGCRDTMNKEILVTPMPGIHIPNSFTPNDDAKNETFFPLSENIKDYRILIYNRWGQVVFNGEENKPWDGKTSNEGVYVYKISGTDFFNQPFEKYGEVTLLK
ncbi:MAG: PKD domain-containing protein [Bacteroidetes bacterium]|nr:PKD domain-containing protein [Bacteroidota bacterium]